MAIKRYIGIKKETTYGEFEVGIDTWIEAIETIAGDQGWIIPDLIGTRERRKKNLGPWRAKGNIRDFPLEPENAGDLITGALGIDNVGDLGGGFYGHTILPSDTIPSYSLRIGLDNISERRFSGCLISNITMKFVQGADAVIGISIFQGATIEVLGAASSATLSPLDAFTYHQAKIELEGSTISTDVYDAEVSIDNSIIDRGALGTRFVTTKRIGSRTVRGKLSLFFKDTTEYQRFLNGTEFDLKISVTNGNYSLSIHLPRCIYRSSKTNLVAMNEPIVVDGEFEAFYDSSSGYEVRVILKNTKSSAY